tara:strand:- start:682 stop:1278 length:597 start_codon:yes stop_codon:yes gene_type:complete
MKKVLFLFLFFITSVLGAEEKLTLIAIVNNTIITGIDISNEIIIIKLLNKNIDPKSPEVKRVALENAINEILKTSEIEKNNIKSSDKNQIDSQYAELLKKITQGNDLISSNTKKKIYNKIKLDYEWNDLIQKKYSWKININMNEIDEKLKNIKEKTEDQSKLLTAKEELIKIEKNKKLNIYSNNYLEKIKKNSLIKFF